MAVIDDHFVATAVTTAQTYQSSNKESGINPIVMVVATPTVVTTSYKVDVQVSFDNTNWKSLYITTISTAAAAWKRIIFSGSGAASDTDSATVGSTINKSPILEPYVQIIVTPVAALTATFDIIYSDPARG